MENLYAIGDVHGEAGLLASLLGAIAEKARDEVGGPAVFFLGDIVDRGPDSKEALDLVCDTLQRWPRSRLLLGNHDKWFLDFLDAIHDLGEAPGVWIDQGGRETLASYGFGAHRAREAREAILAGSPRHAAVLRQASIIETRGDFVFVHAGIDPAKPVGKQSREDCLWIRAPFLNHVGRLSHIVVHGHSPQQAARPVVTENRISLDTGAFSSGVLTAFAFEPATGIHRFLAARRDGSVRAAEPLLLDRGFGTALG